jgi:tetratricopeptide (TPR) repeat protein
VRTYLIGYIDHALADDQTEAAVNALEQLTGLWLAHELRALTPDPELASAAERVYAAAAASGQERPALLAIGLAQAFADADGRARAEASYAQITEWLLRTNDFPTEARVVVDLDRVLEDITAHFPSPYLVDALADVYLQRFRAAQRTPSLSGSGDPRIPFTGYLLARLYLRADDLTGAVAAMDRIEGGEPTDELRSSIAAAEEASRTGRSPEAIDQLLREFTPQPDDRLPPEIVQQSWGIVDNLARRSLARFPDHSPAELARGRVLRAHNYLDAAIIVYERSFAGKIRPTDREDLHVAWSELAELYQLALEAHADSDSERKDMLARVERFHARANEVWPQRPVEPDIALAWMTVALAEFNTGHIAEAEALMQQTLVLEPHPAALALLGTIALRRGEFEDARTHLTRLGKLSDRFGDEIDRYDWQTNSKIGLAEVELFSGKREAGVTQLREALRQLNTLLSYPGLSSPLRAEFSLRRARVFFLLDEVELAMHDAREAQRLAPERNDTISDPLMFTVVHGHLAQAEELLTFALGRDDIGELGIYYALWVSDLAERLGKPIPEPAREHLRKFATDSDATAWQRKLASYGLGELSYDELAKLAHDPRERSELYFYEGLRRWRSGSLESSLELMRKVIEQQMMGDFEYQMAQSYLRWKELPKTARAA